MNRQWLLNHYMFDGDTIVCTKPPANRPDILNAVLRQSLNGDGYMQVSMFGKMYAVHRLMWIYFNGDIPKGLVVDHIDGNKLNNVLSNFRLGTKAQNCFNSRTPCNKMSNLPKGVRKNGDSYLAGVTYQRKEYRKTFKSLDDAISWVQSKRLELHGEFANHG